MNSRRLLALNVRKLRVARGLSQEGLAADAKLERAHLGRIEREKENPSLDVLDRIANALEVRIGALFDIETAAARGPIELSKGRKPTKRRRKPA
jgi:transcriptional regulator with XRE-family HTH domain